MHTRQTTMTTITLRPSDIPVALQIALTPASRYESLASTLGIALSAAHRSVQRLELAALLVPGERTARHHAILEFLLHGARYAFPAVLGRTAVGVPTAHAAPPLHTDGTIADPVVWSAAHGTIRGESLTPLYPGAPRLIDRNPPVYELLALVDAIRLGRARDRRRATELLESRLRGEHDAG
jgi:hypothetical protein